MEQPNLGKRISGLRKAKGLTQEELAEQCKVSTRTLQRIESGVVTPRAYTVRAIFAALGCKSDDSSARDPQKEDSFVSRHFEQAYKYIKDLFNLKTNTMKKVSILSVFALTVGFGLFALSSESKAQKKDNGSYFPSRGIVYLIPRGVGDVVISNTKDTALYKFGKYRIQEYNKQIFLDGEFIEFVEEGDTVILNKGTLLKKAQLEFRRVKYQKILAQKGITFLSPKHLPFTLSIKIGEGGEMRWESKNNDVFVKNNQIFINEDNQIFLNDVYQGDVFENDTVILKPKGTLTIKKAQRD